ncbi:hypothetical protein [Jannaschia donghaensis]|uniref:Haloacid dehalogenase-like hydrolase n=1 Tax=Jannaschia donghaensis TaxID=420998 RepID=A0A0M6YFH4_9RHOB|nr:hypothetical protein [Jannaschia donghaensis]CTQ49122.1 haloacid dehalogenase-like hydrolase [Jannaschia donghaensis]
MSATHPHIPRILLAFDFDRTLATDSVEAICAAYDIDRSDWERDFEEALGDGWDEIIRRGQALIDLGRARGRPLGRDVMADAAKHIRLYDGVMEMPDRLRAEVAEVVEGVELEFVILSSGFVEIIEASGIGPVFDRILAGAWKDGDDGVFSGVKRIIGHPQKALYLEALGKGISVDGDNAPERAVDPVDPGDMHCPFDQMIYLGDGASDLQAFGFLGQAGGLTIAIDKDGDFDTPEQTRAQRVDNLAPPDYSAGGELLQALTHAVRAAAHRIALRRMGLGE